MHEHAPLPPRVRETVDLWVSDFLERPAAAAPAARVGEEASSLLASFLAAACSGKEPPDLEAPDVSHALLDHLAGTVPAAKADAALDLVAAFLADLEDVGRLSGGRALGAQARAAAPAFRQAAGGKGTPLVRGAKKVGRNEPCPCGSGKKYKHCCLRALG